MEDFTCSAAFDDLGGHQRDDAHDTRNRAGREEQREGDTQLHVATVANAAPGQRASQPAPTVAQERVPETVDGSPSTVKLATIGTSLEAVSDHRLDPVVTYPDFDDGTRLRVRSDGKPELLDDDTPQLCAGRPQSSSSTGKKPKDEMMTPGAVVRVVAPGLGPLSKSSPAMSTSSAVAAFVSVPTSKMWVPGRPLRVAFPVGTSQARADAILATAREWTKNCNTALVDAGNHYGYPGGYPSAEIRIAFHVDRYASLIGATSAPLSLYRPTMLLGGLDNLSPRSDKFRRTVLHEFGHALGLLHAHQNPAVTLKWQPDAILEDAREWGWDADDVERNITRPASKDEVLWSIYDPTSIMHYAIPSDWVKPPMGYQASTKLTAVDAAFGRVMYPFPDDPHIITDLTIGQNPTHNQLGRAPHHIYRMRVESEDKESGFHIIFSDVEVAVDLYDGEGNSISWADSGGQNEERAKLAVTALSSPGDYLFAWVSRTSPAGNINYEITAVG